MEINRQNYELYLLDYIEGNLPDNMELAVLTFLNNNPDIAKDVKELTENIFSPETIKFSPKESLKKNPLQDIPGISKFEQLSIAYLENEISAWELNDLNNAISLSEEKNKEHKLIQKTKLQADYAIIFKGKNQLKHFNSGAWLTKNRNYFALAASIVLLIGFSLFFMKNSRVEYGKGFTAINFDFKTRQIVEYQLTMENNDLFHINQDSADDSKDSVEFREKTFIEKMSNRQFAQIQISSKNDSALFSDLAKIKPSYSINEDDGYKTLQKFLNEKFKEKVLKQNKNEKISLVSVVNTFGRFTNKVFHKNIELEKTINENGSSLYALRTGSYDLYTKRSARNKDKTIKEKKSTKID
jgi:hypothetical protein